MPFKPGPESRKVLKRDRKVISQCLTRVNDFVFKKGQGVFVWDADNRKYLDFNACVAVLNVGHANPEVLKAIKAQLGKGLHCGFPDFVAETPVAFAEELVSFLPRGLDKVFLSNSGTEAVEAAYKNARWHSRKKWFIAFERAFHGRTMGALSLTASKPVHKNRFDPFLPVKHSPFAYCYRCPWKASYPGCGLPCLDALEKKIKSCQDNLAGVALEPVQGEGGYVVPPKEFLKGVRKLCTQYQVSLVADEIQSGCYRTGQFLASQSFGIKPDIVALGKAIGGGLPIGATAFTEKNSRWLKGSHANTFGGNLLACAAGQASLKFMRRQKLGRNALRVGRMMFKRLKEVEQGSSLIGDVRGKGLMIGVELVKNKKTKEHALKESHGLIDEACRQGLLLLPCGFSSIRLAPPLTISLEQAEKGLDIFERALKTVEGKS
jgi:4-aminobutyrate aminotransferase